MIDAELLKVLACPWCVTRPEPGKSHLAKGELELQGPAAAPNGLKCKQCGRVYKIDADGLPNLLVDEAVLPAKG
ncbi:MAG TPA: Trm112 family protein [Planctomycetota bacterium]|nr:Trm112 family protein [Planctomycetota bacterium]